MTMVVHIPNPNSSGAAPVDPAALMTQVEQQHNLPPGILGATAQVESGNGRYLHSGQADGRMQITPANAKAAGIDPMDDNQSIPWAGKTWADNIKATNGDIDRAAMMYHGGPDTSQWGPLTRAYPGKLLAALGPAQGAQPGPAQAAPAGGGANAPDDFEAALPPARLGATGATQGSPSVGTLDPFEAALPRDISERVPSNFQGAAGSAPVGMANTGAGRLSGASGAQLGPNLGGVGATVPSPNSGQPAGSGTFGLGGNGASARPGVDRNAPQAHQATGFAGAFHGLADEALYVAQGLQDVKQGGLELIGRGTDAIGLTHGFGDSVAAQRKAGQAATDKLAYDPNGPGAGVGRVSGQILGTIPLGAVRALGGLKIATHAAEALAAGTKVSNIARLAAATARVSDSALQGAAGGAIVGAPGSDPMHNAGVGALIGGGIGTVAHGVGSLVQALRRAAGIAAPEAAAGVSAVAPAVAPAAASDFADAIASGGARRGLIDNADLPPTVIAHARGLTAQGVPVNQALREAESLHIGAQPTVADVTRNYADQQATKEGAKLATPEGQALMERQTANNAAAHSAVSGLVDQYGGIPAKGEAPATVQRVLAAASDAEKGKVSGLYDAAKAADQSITVRPDALRETLAGPDFQTPKTAAGSAFANGMRADLANVTNPAKGGARGLGATELERLRQSANATYDASAPAEVNGMVAKVKGAIDQSFDELGNSSDAYKTARAAHRDWAQAYDIPGVADLIKRDASGAFVNSPQKLGNAMLANTDDRAFGNVVARLKANGNTDAIDKLKASTIQDAYEAVTKAAHDAGGHTLLNGRLFLQKLDGLGQGKLDALFSPAEQGNIASIGRGAMHVNEAVQGSVNNSNTSSAAINALSAAMSKSRPAGTAKSLGIDVAIGSAAQGLGHAIWPGVGGAVAGGGISAAKLAVSAMAARKASSALASALTTAGSPTAARATQAANVAKLAAALASRQAGNRIAGTLSAPAGAVVANGRR